MGVSWRVRATEQRCFACSGWVKGSPWVLVGAQAQMGQGLVLGCLHRVWGGGTLGLRSQGHASFSVNGHGRLAEEGALPGPPRSEAARLGAPELEEEGY